jgi:hypothetical protein
MKRLEIFSGNWTEIDVMKSSHKYFVFGDNCERWGKGGQAIIRDLKNTIGIRTKKKPDNFSTSFLTDDEYNTNSKLILEDILVIKEKNLLDEDIVVSKNGYGTGLAKMSERSPLTFNYLNDSLKNLLHFDNTLGVHYYRLPSGNEIASGDYVSLTDILQPNNNSLPRNLWWGKLPSVSKSIQNVELQRMQCRASDGVATIFAANSLFY